MGNIYHIENKAHPLIRNIILIPGIYSKKITTNSQKRLCKKNYEQPKCSSVEKLFKINYGT